MYTHKRDSKEPIPVHKEHYLNKKGKEHNFSSKKMKLWPQTHSYNVDLMLDIRGNNKLEQGKQSLSPFSFLENQQELRVLVTRILLHLSFDVRFYISYCSYTFLIEFMLKDFNREKCNPLITCYDFIALWMIYMYDSDGTIFYGMKVYFLWHTM